MSARSLPVEIVLPEILDGYRQHGAVVVRASTGAGKTTRVPPALLDAVPQGRIVVLEPRRVAARAAAKRVAEERGSRLGGEVGYRIRFEGRSSQATRLLFVTEGVLLRMVQDDPFLEDVAAVVLDEFHERSLQSDLALAMLQRIRTTVRPDLGVVVMSATMETGPVASFLGDAPVVESEGRLFPVEVVYAPPSPDVPLERAVRGALLDQMGETPGDLLVFLPGVGEIRRTEQALREIQVRLDADVLPLHGELPPERQDLALARGSRRKIVLATNVAETSVTLPGVTAVIDSGYERIPVVEPSTGLQRLERVRISRESADQRSGRAGRTAPGRAIRLWGRGEDARLSPRRAPQIHRADLADLALQLHAWGERDLTQFPFFEPPPAAALQQAETLLERLGAIEGGVLTDTGKAMVRLPAHPRLARLAVESSRVGHPRRLALAAAVLGDRSPLERVHPYEESEHHSSSDVLDVVEAMEAYEDTGRLDAGMRRLRRGPARRALRARDQLARALGKDTAEPGAGALDPDEAVLRALLAAYPDRLARRRAAGAESGVMVGGRGVRFLPSSAVKDAELVVCVDVDLGARGERQEARVRMASKVDRAWLGASRIETVEDVVFDPASRSVRGIRRVLYEDLVLEEALLKTPRGEAVERRLAEAAAMDLDAALGLEDPAVVSLRARVGCLREWRPELGLPSLGDEAVRALLPELVRGRRSFAELRRAPLLEHLRSLLDWKQGQALDRDAPERLQVPSGSRIALRYEPGRPPVLAVRIQEVFGLAETPTVAGGRVRVLMHLLAPNQRPQQITDDMASFWAKAYHDIRAELRRRYPKHAWPEDPLATKPERHPRRRGR